MPAALLQKTDSVFYKASGGRPCIELSGRHKAGPYAMTLDFERYTLNFERGVIFPPQLRTSGQAQGWPLRSDLEPWTLNLKPVPHPYQGLKIIPLFCK
jgi:hypothetical protein